MGTANTVLSPAKRQAALEHGESLLAPREIVPLAVNPFYPEAFAETVAGLGRTTGPPRQPPAAIPQQRFQPGRAETASWWRLSRKA